MIDRSPRFTDSEALKYRQSVRAGETTCREISKSTNVPLGTVGKMLRGITYKHVPDAIPDLPPNLMERSLRVFSDEQVLKWRRAVRKRKITRKALAKRERIGHDLLRKLLFGETYSHVPEALDPEGPRVPPLFSDDQVLRFRRAVRKGTRSRESIRQQYKLSKGYVREMLNGYTYAHVSEALDKGTYNRPRLWTDEEVLGYRRAIARKEISRAKLIRKLSPISSTTVSNMLTGVTYPHVPEKVGRATIMLTEAEIIAYRKRVVVDDPATYAKVKAELKARGFDRCVITNMLTGRTFGHLPDAVPKIPRANALPQVRNLPDEVVLFMRLIVRGGLNIRRVAQAYGIGDQRANQIIRGKSYKDVPEAITDVQFMAARRTLTDEQVMYCRRMYRTGQISYHTLAVEVGSDLRIVRNAVRGLTYKHLPNPVPDHIRSRRPPTKTSTKRAMRRKRNRRVRASTASIQSGNVHQSTSPNLPRPSEADCLISG